MSNETKFVNYYFAIAIIGLTILFGVSLYFQIQKEYSSTNDFALIEGKASYNKDLLYRRWASMHGGVYVPITEVTPPNPALSHIPDRDITTLDGAKLTLVNPAYMTRQVHELAEGQYGVKGHITSLNPIRVENKPDEWETKALKMFENGINEYHSIEIINGKKYTRFMHSMTVEQSCLKCHAIQGYKVGDIRGGISVSVPMEKYAEVAAEHIQTLLIIYLVLYITIISLTYFGFNLLKKEILKRHQLQSKIIESEAHYRMLFENMNSGFILFEVVQNQLGHPIDLTILAANDKFEEAIGVSLIKSIGKNLTEVLPGIDKDGANWIEMYSNVALSGNPIQFEQKSDLLGKYYSASAFKVANKQCAVTFNDITERKIAEAEILKAKEKAEESEREIKQMYEELASVEEELRTSHDQLLITSNALQEKYFELDKEKEFSELNILKLNKVQEISHVGSWHLNIETNEVYWTNELFKMYGFDPNKPVPPYTEHMKLFTPESWEILSTSLAKTRETGIPYELELKTIREDKSSGWMWMRGEAVKDENDNIIGLWGAAQDITERKQIERELLKAKEKAEDNELKYRLFIEQTTEGIYRFDIFPPVSINMPVEDLIDYLYINTLITECNLAMAKMYGCEGPDELMNLKMVDFHGGTDDPVNREVMRTFVVNDFKVSNSETIEKDKNGNFHYFSNTSIGIVRDNLLFSIWGSQTDITDKKKYELDLLKAKEKAEESDRLKSAFLANMSHEIRTPMNGILGFADLLKQPDITGDEQKEFISIIEQSGVRMLNIINNIIDVSKIESGMMEIDLNETNINELIDYIYTFFKPESDAKNINLKVSKSLPSDEATIYTDQEKIYAILTNLVKNAIKYTETGMIEFGYNLKFDNDISVLEFYVTDTGIGIPQDRQQAIFERFVQADIADKMARQGAGLGLTITRAYLDMLNGKIWVESEEGVGSTFYFSLPFDNQI